MGKIEKLNGQEIPWPQEEFPASKKEIKIFDNGGHVREPVIKRFAENRFQFEDEERKIIEQHVRFCHPDNIKTSREKTCSEIYKDLNPSGDLSL